MFEDNSYLFNGVIELIEKWNSPILDNEKDYQEDLYEYLCRLQDEGRIKQERRILRERGTNRADIVIDDKIAIELKKDLRHQPSVDRCVAQIKRMKNEYDFVIVVIVGENNSRQHIDMLKHELREFLQNDGIMGNNKNIRVLWKKEGRREEKQQQQNSDVFNTSFNIKDLI